MTTPSNAELRETIKGETVDYLGLQEGTEACVDAIMTLFQAREQQLLTELLDEAVTSNRTADSLHTYVPVSAIEAKLEELK